MKLASAICVVAVCVVASFACGADDDDGAVPGGDGDGGTSSGTTASGGSSGTPGGGSSSDAGVSSSGGSGTPDGGLIAGPDGPAVARAGDYLGFPERFNRYYTDPAYAPASTKYVSPTGSGDGATRETPAAVQATLAAAAPGTTIVFTAGTYAGCYELDSDHSGTYDAPIVLTGERDADGTLRTRIDCCTTGRQSCFNLEDADYIAIDAFELVGGKYGVRSVGGGYAANEHQLGTAILNCDGHEQANDPFFSGQSDWLVLEKSVAHDVGDADGHGIYLSNGSDWNVVRYNETYNTSSADFQINADPESTCSDDGVEPDSAECDAVAGSSTTGGRGASDFMLVDGNFFHHSGAQGANFTSVRRSVVQNNLFVLSARHGVSFWQETDNPNLGSSQNRVQHNLFVTSQTQQALSFIVSSTGNIVQNNVVAAVQIAGATVSGRTAGVLLTTDATTVAANALDHNVWLSGSFDTEDDAPAYVPDASDLRRTDFDPAWFQAFPATLARDAHGFVPVLGVAPWSEISPLLATVPKDRDGTTRLDPTTAGPFEIQNPF